MKYLKVTLGLFIVTMIAASINIQAEVKQLVDVTIPVFTIEYMTKGTKSTDAYQYIKKTQCTDDISGDGRAITAGLHETTGSGNPNYDPARVLVGYSNVSFDNNSRYMGSWNLYLRSQKTFPTTASFYGTWTLN